MHLINATFPQLVQENNDNAARKTLSPESQLIVMPTMFDAFVPDHAAYSVRWVICIGKTMILRSLCVMPPYPKSGNGQDAKTVIALRFKLGVLLRWLPVASNSRDGKNLSSFRLCFLAKEKPRRECTEENLFSDPLTHEKRRRGAFYRNQS